MYINFIYSMCIVHYILYYISTSLSEEKRRVENRLSTLEEDLEEEQTNSEAAIDKARKAEQQVDSLSGEVSHLQNNVQKAEAAKSQLEKQVCVLLRLYVPLTRR